MIHSQWLEMAKRFENIALDKCVVMPNHFQGVIIIIDNECNKPVGASLVGAPTGLTCGKGQACLRWVKLLLHSNLLRQTNISEALNNTIGHRFPGNCGNGIMEPAQSEADGNVLFETKTN